MVATIALPVADADPSAALAGGIALFASLLVLAFTFLFAGRNDKSWEARDRRLVWATAVCSMAGLGVCFAGLCFGVERWHLIAGGFLASGCVGCLTMAARRGGATPKSGWLAESLSRVRGGWIHAAGVVGCLLILGLVGWLFWNGAQLDSGVVVRKYHVRWTCTDGVCSVNECTSPAPCGEQAVGRLREGEVADITCQTRGEPVPMEGRVSTIWDKLVNGNFVTDFYIDTPGINQFTLAIPRCPRIAL